MLIFILAGLFALLLAAAAMRTRSAPSTRSRLTISWGDAWLKSAVIVIGIALFMIMLPAKVMELDAVTSLDRTVQDLVGASVWAVGTFGSLAALVWAQKKELI